MTFDIQHDRRLQCVEGQRPETEEDISLRPGIAALAGAAAVNSAHAGVPVHAEESDSYSATVRCHDANGELYNVTLSRDRVTLQSYSDDAIRTKVETWADTVPQLA